jgi:hypothetical protein
MKDRSTNIMAFTEAMRLLLPQLERLGLDKDQILRYHDEMARDAGITARLAKTRTEGSTIAFVDAWRTGQIDGLPVQTCRFMDLYAAYVAWCERSGKTPETSRKLSRIAKSLPTRRVNIGLVIDGAETSGQDWDAFHAAVERFRATAPAPKAAPVPAITTLRAAAERHGTKGKAVKA